MPNRDIYDTACDDPRPEDKYVPCESCGRLILLSDTEDGLCPECAGREPEYDDRWHQMNRR